jgi:hypothetical protein
LSLPLSLSKKRLTIAPKMVSTVIPTAVSLTSSGGMLQSYSYINIIYILYIIPLLY